VAAASSWSRQEDVDVDKDVEADEQEETEEDEEDEVKWTEKEKREAASAWRGEIGAERAKAGKRERPGGTHGRRA
jgi:hypothetical protein